MISFIFFLISGLFLLLVYLRKIPLSSDTEKDNRLYERFRISYLVGSISLLVLSVTYLL